MENVYYSHEKQNEWHKKNRFIHQNVLPHTNWQNVTKAGRTNSRTNCQQIRIAISRTNTNSFSHNSDKLHYDVRQENTKEQS